MVPQREQFGAATEAILDAAGPEQGSRAYLRDIGDHLAQVTGELYRQTDDLGALTSTYFNANANRLNRLATRLTVLATFFLIWTLVTSFFGQNFKLADRPHRLVRGVPALRDDLPRAAHGPRRDLLLAEAEGLAGDPAPGAARRRRVPPAGGADPRRLLLRRLLQLHEGAARARGPRPARDDAGVPAQGVDPRRRSTRRSPSCAQCSGHRRAGRRAGRTAGTSSRCGRCARATRSRRGRR